MSEVIDVAANVQSIVELIAALQTGGDRAKLLAQISDKLEELQSADERMRAELEAFFEKASKGSAGVADAEATLSSRKNESAVAKALLPSILSLKRYLTDTSPDDDPGAHHLLEKAVNIAAGYVAGYPDLRDQLIGFDAELRTVAGRVLYARPVTGEIDHAALSREFMARYPKLRAALAK